MSEQHWPRPYPQSLGPPVEGELGRLRASPSFILYPCSRWIFLVNFSAPNPVRNLTVGARTNSSITLHWEVPEGSDSQNLTYWVQCTGDGRNETQNTTDTSLTVDGLNSASWYEFSVWVEKDGVSGSREVLNATTGEKPHVHSQFYSICSLKKGGRG